MNPRRFSARPLATPLVFSSLAVAACCPATPAQAPCVCESKVEPAPKAPTPLATEVRLIEDFEDASGRSGGFWYEYDKNPLGTVANPKPFTLSPGGSSPSPGSAAHIWGTLGADRAPWTWVQLQVFLNRQKKSEDLTGFKSVSFWVKGDGGRYAISLVRDAVTDYDHYHYEFAAPKEWTEIRVPLDAFRQHGWGKPVPSAPADVKFLQFSPAAHDKPFDVWIDHVSLSPDEVKQEPFAYDTTGWFPFTGLSPVARRGTALDVSRLLDAPAGKHGNLGKRGENFVFRDGTPAKFIGINIVASANFPTHEEADKLAELLAQMGVNMTRHHHMDAAWSHPNLFGNKADTLSLDPAAMERFDYLVNQLQKRGIYQFFDMLVHRKVTAADGVANADKLAAGLKIEGQFEPKLIELQERFITQFMGHKNQYTNRTYARDPAVVMVEAINEDSLFWLMPEGDFSVKTKEGRDLLARQFSAYLQKQGVKDRAGLEKRWAGTGKVLGPEEDPTRGTVDAFVATGKALEKELSPARARDTLRFYHELVFGYYQRIEKVLRGLGYQGEYTGSNHWSEHPLDLAVNAEFDFVDRHAYWAHPEGGWGYKTEVGWDNSPMVKDPELGIIGSLARRRVKGLPYTASEWQTSAPNDYRHEGLLMMGAYSAFQGMSPIQFALSHDINRKVDQISTMTSNFDVLEQPTMLGAWPAVATLFHRGDVRPAQIEAYLSYDKEKGFEPGASFSYPAKMGLIARTGVDFGVGKTTAELDALRAKYVAGTRVVSSTGELRHDASLGRFEVDTPRTQGVVTFATEQPIELTQTKIELSSPFGVVIVTALDEEPVQLSRRLLVTALGNAVNTGMKLTTNKSGFVEVGRAPILVEPLRGKVSIVSSSQAKAHCYPLELSGARKAEIPVVEGGGWLTLELSARHQTMHYEIVR